MRIPARPALPPSIVSPRRRTTTGAGSGDWMKTPPNVFPRIVAPVATQSIVIDLVMLTGPYSPASGHVRTPRGAVVSCAAWNVAHGAVRVQSVPLPVPDT